MDKWDEARDRVTNGILAEEPQAALMGALDMISMVGRTLERIADTLEMQQTAHEGIPPELQYEPEPEPVHDL